MYKNVKPIVILSNCLEYKACRYNGEVIPNNFIKILEPYVSYKMVCPEVEIGLGVPRDPIKIVAVNNEERLIQPLTGIDLTDKMNNFSTDYLSSIKQADGFILKSKSPSCGIKDVKLSNNIDKGPIIGKTKGFFARAIQERFSGLAIEDESRLSNFTIRENFLTKLFALARFRQLQDRKDIKNLIDYHTGNKYLFMSYNQSKMREMGRIVASYNKSNTQKIYDEYEQLLKSLFSGMSRKKSNINVFMHTLGYFSNYLSIAEKRFFLELLDNYRNNMIPVSSIIVLLKSWIIKYSENYLKGQSFFNPYPSQLMCISDSGKGREH